MFSKCLSRTPSLFLCLACFTLLACGNNEDAEKIKESLDINRLNVTDLRISSPNSVIETGVTEQFTVQAIINNGDSDPIDVSTRVSWSISDKSLASINKAGLLTSRADGLVRITARWADLSDAKELMLSSAALNSISISSADISVCDTYQLTATGSYDDATDRDISSLVTWSSSNSTLLSVNQSGLLTSLGSGAAEISASRNSQTGTTTINIADDLESISISSPSDKVAVNASLAFTATGNYSGTSDSRNNSTENISAIATWSSDNTAVLSISNVGANKGLARGVTEGSANVQASCNTSNPVTSDSEEITVNPAITTNAVSINQDAVSLEFKVIDSPEKLIARLKRSDGSFSTDVTDDNNTIWSIVRVIEGKGLTLSNTKGSKGEITFTEPGITRISVRYHDSEAKLGPFDDEIEIEIVD